MKRELTVGRLRELLDYDPVTGHFSWSMAARQTHAGKPAGTCKDNYLRIVIDGRAHYAHNLAWLYFYGESVGSGEIVRYRSGFSTAIGNLYRGRRSRPVVQPGDPRWGTGLVHMRSGRWGARVWLGDEQRWIGTFNTVDEAQKAIYAAVVKHRRRGKIAAAAAAFGGRP